MYRCGLVAHIEQVFLAHLNHSYIEKTLRVFLFLICVFVSRGLPHLGCARKEQSVQFRIAVILDRDLAFRRGVAEILQYHALLLVDLKPAQMLGRKRLRTDHRVAEVYKLLETPAT